MRAQLICFTRSPVDSAGNTADNIRVTSRGHSGRAGGRWRLADFDGHDRLRRAIPASAGTWGGDYDRLRVALITGGASRERQGRRDFLAERRSARVVRAVAKAGSRPQRNYLPLSLRA